MKNQNYVDEINSNIYSGSEFVDNLFNILKSYEVKDDFKVFKDGKEIVENHSHSSNKEETALEILTEEFYRLHTKSDGTQAGHSKLQKNVFAYWEERNWKIEKVFKEGTVIATVLKRGSHKRLPISGFAVEQSENKVKIIRRKEYFETDENDLIKQTYNWLTGEYSYDTTSTNFIRFYFDLKPNIEGIEKLKDLIASYFNFYQIPFKFKYLLLGYSRSDSGVLYITRNHFNFAIILLKKIILHFPNINELLNTTVPFYSYKIQDGIGFGDSADGLSDSLGKNRAKILAKIFVENKKIDKKEHLIEFVKSKGYCINEFYRNPYNFYKYDFSLFSNTVQISEGKIKIFPNSFEENEAKNGSFNRARLLDSAIKIGFELCSNAIWVENKCNWVSVHKIKDELSQNEFIAYKATGSTFKDGILGILFFLVNLNNIYSDIIIIFTINGIINQINSSKECFIISKKELKILEEIKKNFPHLDLTHCHCIDLNLTLVENLVENEIYKVVDNVVFKTQPVIDDYEKAESLKQKHIFDTNPFPNALDNDLFCPLLNGGLAEIGYFYLRLYAPDIIKIINI